MKPSRSLLSSIALLLAALGSGCTAPFAKLDGILVETRPALPTEYGRVQVTRGGTILQSQPKMGIEKGDLILTAADGVALLTLRDGYEVIFEPGTDATIENPSIFMRLGKILVKVVAQVKEALSVNGEFVSAGVRGTVFTFEVSRNKTVNIQVVEGRVTVKSKVAGWDSVTYVGGEWGTIRAGSRPEPVRRLPPDSARAIERRFAEVEGVARPSVPDLRGLPEEGARAILQSKGLQQGSTTRVITRTARPGIIVGSRPSPGSLAKAGDRVSLQVEDSSLVVPRVTGQSLGGALRILAAAGFRNPDTTSFYSPNSAVGTVMGVAPSEGTAVSVTTRVVLNITRNIPDPAPPPPPVRDTTRTGTCTVPNLLPTSARAYTTRDAATRMITSAGLTVGRITQQGDGRVVVAQRLKGGTRVRCGTAVDFTLGTIIED